MFKLFKTPHTRTNQTRKNTTRPSDVVCCDQTYAKSKQGIFKLVMLLGSFLAWMCCATTPYVKVKILKFYHFLQFSATFSQFFWFFFSTFLIIWRKFTRSGVSHGHFIWWCFSLWLPILHWSSSTQFLRLDTTDVESGSLGQLMRLLTYKSSTVT